MARPLRLIALTATCILLCPALLIVAPASAKVFSDEFADNSIDPSVWSLDLYGSGAQVVEQNQQLEFVMLASSSGDEFGARLVSVFKLRGDFDIQVDFNLMQWPSYNGVRLAIGLTDAPYDNYGMERSSLSASEPLGAQEVYVADFGPFVLIQTEDVAGKIRLVRSGGTQTGYFYGPGGWVLVLTDAAPSGDITIQLHSWSHDYAFQNDEVRAAFDNFRVESGELIWPTTTTRTTSWGAIKALYRSVGARRDVEQEIECAW